MIDLVRDAHILGLAVLAGFVAAGIVASGYQWVTSKPPEFVVLGKSSFGLASTFLFCAFSGPMIMLEHALRAPVPRFRWICAGLAISAVWSSCSGIVILRLIIAMRQTVA